MISQADYDRFKRRAPQPIQRTSHRAPARSDQGIINSPPVPLNQPPPPTQTATPPLEVPFVRQPEPPTNYPSVAPATTALKSDIDSRSPARQRKLSKKPLVFALGFIVAAVIALGLIKYLGKKQTGPIPLNDVSAVAFPVYYPEASKLPNGYTLNKSSFNLPAKNVLIYNIDSNNSQHLSVSLQQQPSQSNLSKFLKLHMPLNISVNTPVGKATIGNVNSQTVASLPTSSNTWIIVSGPSSFSQSTLQKVLNSFTKQ